MEISLGGSHTCAVRLDGSIWCWGANNGWQTGSTGADKQVPAPVAGLSNGVAVSMGYEFSCALADGAVQCWGAGSSGQHGDGTGVTSYIPKTTLLASPTAVSFPKQGHWHACAITSNGGAECWGYDKHGVLGLGVATTTAHLTPAPVVNLSGVEQLSMGEFHSCALTTGGNVKCWGYNGFGELGNGELGGSDAYPTPVDVVNLTGAKQIAAGKQYTCAITADDGVACWGSGSYGKLGNGTLNFKSSPFPVSNLSDVGQVASGFGHACAVKHDGTVWCWGRNDYGQLGNGSIEEAHVPVQVPNISDAARVATGFYHTCAATDSGQVFCWGRNSRGQLGIGNLDEKHLPAAVAF